MAAIATGLSASNPGVRLPACPSFQEGAYSTASIEQSECFAGCLGAVQYPLEQPVLDLKGPENKSAGLVQTNQDSWTPLKGIKLGSVA